MSLRDRENAVDTHRVIAKTIYFGMFANVLAPMGLLLVCFYFDKYKMVDNKVGDMGEMIFYLFGLLAVGHAAYAFWSKSKAMRQPMVRRIETLEQDLVEGLIKALRPTFLVIASISLYGYLYFYLTGRFQEAVFVVLFSFLVFQVVRPRYGAVEKFILYQKSLVQRGDTGR
ncbi:MAG: hypothetical protein P1R58_08660 [bacterium]|nr:hypothetical protein [bacterium]